MATLQQWVDGARPRTLPAAIAPVLVGTGSAYAMRSASPGVGLLAAVVALALQVGVNYANDYSDGVRGTDAERVGPVRLVGQGLARPVDVKAAAFAAFGVAAIAGLALAVVANRPLLLLLGLAGIVAAWRYTGGENPYGYRGLGEVFVFIFFGLVAVAGTTYAQAGTTDLATWAGAAGAGCISTALLVVNNLRDIPGDTKAGKRTLAVRLGPARTRLLYVTLMCLPPALAALAGLVHPWALLALLTGAAAYRPVRTVMGGASGRDLVPVLQQTGLYLLAYGLLLGLGLYLSQF